MIALRLAVAFLAAGGVAVTAGAWMAWPPAGWMVGGVVLMAVGVEALRPPRGGA